MPAHVPSPSDLLLAAAVPFELRPFARRLGIADVETGPSHGGTGDRSVSLLAAGMGRPGDRAFRQALDDLRPRAVVNVGIAGALDLEHPAGSTWIVEQWLDAGHPHEPAGRADPTLTADVGERLTHAGVRWSPASAVTVDQPLHDPGLRDRIRDGTGAHLVEMEGAHWAAIAAERGVPFAAVRVVSDHANRPLPGPRPAVGRRAWLMRDDGSIRRGRLMVALLASTAWLRPRHHMRELREAGAQFGTAVDALERVAAALLD